MKEQIVQWQKKWQSLSASDQRALGLLSLFAGVLFIIFGLFQPARHYFERSQSSAAESRQLLEWIDSQKSQLARLRPAGSAAEQAEGTLLQRVTSAAQSHQVTIKRFEPEGDGRIRLWIDAARYQDLQPWLNNLLQQHFTIRSINVDALGEVGMVSARLTLEG